MRRRRYSRVDIYEYGRFCPARPAAFSLHALCARKHVALLATELPS